MNRRNPNRNNNPRSNHSVQNMSSQNKHNYTQSIQNTSNAIPQNSQFPQKQALTSVRSGPCVLCKASTVLLCQRCDDFYCSPNCQMKDWPKHRYICFKMPALIPSSSRLTQDLPALNGYQNRELPTITPVWGSPQNSQNRKWVNNNSPMSPTPQQQPQQQPQHQPPPQQHPKEEPKPQQEGNRKTAQTAGMNLGKIDQAPFPKSNSAVLLTVFRSSNRIFVRSIEKNENDGYCEVIKTINEYGKTAGPLKRMPYRNAFAITDFDNDNLFYRVQVVSAKNENEIKVIYYDFGNEATKKLSELKEISKECAQLKQYIMLISLKNVPHVANNDKLKEYLKSFEEIEGTIVYDEGEKPACEIIPWGVEESINKKINLFIQLLKNKGDMEHKLGSARNGEERRPKSPVVKKVESPPVKPNVPSPRSTSNETAVTPPIATKKRPSQLVKPVMSPPFEIVHLPVGQKNVDIMVVDNSLILFGYFGCVLCSDKNNLQDIRKYLADYEDNGQVYKPKVDEYCLVKFEGRWYRAKALTILSTEIVEVVFIDFLNESNVNVKSIRRYPMDMDYPCKTSLCMIEDLPSELSDDIVKVLKDKLQPGSEHTINEVKGVEEDAPDVFIIKMNQVAKWLNDKA